MLRPEEAARKIMVDIINPAVAAMADPRAELETMHGQVWDTEEMKRDYSVLGFGAPFVIVTRKSDGVRGSLMFSRSPRFYFNFSETA